MHHYNYCIIRIPIARKWFSRRRVYTKHWMAEFLSASVLGGPSVPSSSARSQALCGRGDYHCHNIDIASEAGYTNTASGPVSI